MGWACVWGLFWCCYLLTYGLLDLGWLVCVGFTCHGFVGWIKIYFAYCG